MDKTLDKEGALDLTGSKVYLVKLVEFNKIAILEKFGFGVKQPSTFGFSNQNPFISDEFPYEDEP